MPLLKARQNAVFFMRAIASGYTRSSQARFRCVADHGQFVDIVNHDQRLFWSRSVFVIHYLSGVDVVQACAQMGHADVTTTLKIYTNLDALHKKKSVDKLDEYLQNGAC